MIKINRLAFFGILVSGLLGQNVLCWAQADIDLFDASENTANSGDNIQIDVSKTFSENLSQDAQKNESSTSNLEDDPKNRETWLESLINRGSSELFKSQSSKASQQEKQQAAKSLMNHRSNAANFDISGVKLRMSPTEVEKILQNKGYRRLSQEVRAPNFIKWRSEELCRTHGVVGFERLNSCARHISKENGFEYVAREIYSRQSTLETLEVNYTSTFTDNLSYRVAYKSNIPFSSSKASQYVYINNLKIYDFWRRIDLRYGQPDNTSEIKWGLGGKKPYMQASTGRLELVDPLLHDLDISRMLNEDSRFANIPYYTF